MTNRTARAALSGPVLLCLTLLMLAEQAMSSGIGINPTRVELDADTRIVALTLNNTGGRDVSFQVELAQWSQVDGEDRYEPADDLLATPPIFTLPAGEQQVVRVGLRRAPHRDEELTYRLFIEELPSPTGEEINGLRMMLRISLPVFVQPLSGPTGPDLSWHTTGLEGGAPALEVHNSGAGHAQISELNVRYGHERLEPMGMFYLLPGATRKIPLEGSLPPDSSAHVAARINGQEFRAKLGTD